MKKNTKWILENKTNYEKIFEDKREKKLDFIIEDLIENRNLSLDTNFDFNSFDLKDMDIATQKIFEAIKNNQKIYIYGVDASPDIKNFLANTNDIQGTVAQSPIQMGRKVAEVIELLREKKSCDRQYLIPVRLINKDNISEYTVTGWQ